jgi:hypothetical protein
MTAGGLVRLDGGRRSLVSLLVLAGAASAAGWPCARHRRSGAEAARHARNGWCKVPFQTARCRIVGCTTAPKLRGCPELAASGQGQQGSAQSRLAPPWPGQRTHGMGRGRAAAGRRELMRPASAIVSAWMSVPPRSQMLPWWGVLGAGCWVKLGVRPISAREAVPLAALRAALDLDALPA